MIYVKGKFLGVKTERITPTDKTPFDVHSIGIQIPKSGGFAGETETIEIRSTQEFQKSGGLADCQGFEAGTMIVIPVTIGARAYQGRGYVSMYAAGRPVVTK